MRRGYNNGKMVLNIDPPLYDRDLTVLEYVELVVAIYEMSRVNGQCMIEEIRVDCRGSEATGVIITELRRRLGEIIKPVLPPTLRRPLF